MYHNKNFSQPFTRPMYNYHDYILAWFNTFYFRNFDYSWFFHFHCDIQKKFPIWFHEWSNIFGPFPNILPDQVQDSFSLFSSFQKEFLSFDPFTSSIFKFFISFSISWIVCWDYVFVSESTLARQIKVK